MSFKAPIGTSDFRKLRESGADYVDKSPFIAEVLADPAEVLLFPRPRRFGKTLNLTTLRYFVEKTDENLSHLYGDLRVWTDPSARRHFQRYPVIFLTFKDIKAATFEMTLRALQHEIQRLFGLHRYVLEGDLLSPTERANFEAVLSLEEDEVLYWAALRDLSTYVARYHQEKVVILIDEYDTPIQSGYTQGFYDNIVRFFRNFFSGGLKDNPHLFKGVLSGVLRVARESLFSGLNNLVLYSLLHPGFNSAFGFTEEEVQRIARADSCLELMDDLRSWYNGYLFGGQVVYNPWSILNFIASRDKVFRPHWVSTSSDDLLRDLLLERGLGLTRDMETLLQGGAIEKPIDDNIVLREVSRRPEALWSFLLFSGYLKAVEHHYDEDGALHARLTIPNREVRFTFKSVFQAWMGQGLQEGARVQRLLNALLSGEVELFQAMLGELMVNALSFHDFGPTALERLYQAFILGLLVNLEPRYEVRSNRESGYGRYDVMVRPREPGLPGVVLELKVLDRQKRESVKRALASALKQLSEKDYAAELREAGASPVIELAAVFDGKHAWVISEFKDLESLPEAAFRSASESTSNGLRHTTSSEPFRQIPRSTMKSSALLRWARGCRSYDSDSDDMTSSSLMDSST